MFAIVLPPGYEELIVADDPAEDCWQTGEDRVLLSYVDDVPDCVAAQLHRFAPRYRPDFSQTTQSFYWMNHCEHCEARLGDFETLQESGTFYDLGVGLNDRKLTPETFHPVAEPFSASCGSHAAVE